MAEIYLYGCTADPKMLDKSGYIGTPYSVNGVFRGEMDVMRPQIDIEGSFTLTGYNYAYLPALSRYYWVRDSIVIRTGLSRLILEIDALMSHAAEIKNLPCYVLRSQTPVYQSPWITDGRAPRAAFDYVAAVSAGTFSPGAFKVLVTAG